ncbi:MAG: hypothetical protein EOO92_01285 [Pedobacter sp.]|nr:MAG: hypothetical protein EOO92_01285 [Pedobacter sp.]
MRIFVFLLLLITSTNAVIAQSDTSAYQTQRLKVNALLNQRSAKFGQYDQSLNAKTGIFGLQTKSDVKNSNEILRQIVVSDNNIFKELKILMDYKDQEVKQAQSKASEVNNKMQNYLQTIKKLQDQNEQIKTETTKSSLGGRSNYIIIALIALLIGMYFYYQNKLKQQK